MIDYSLAKKLNDARFPGGASEDTSLSELIEACGENFESLQKVYDNGTSWFRAYPTDDWFDASGSECVVDCCGYETGDTPEEAVANLWLALNT